MLRQTTELPNLSEKWGKTMQVNGAYNFRQTGNGIVSFIPKNSEPTYVGATFAWNQLVNHGNFDSSSGWNATFTVSDGVASASYTSSGSMNSTLYRSASPISGHKFFVSYDYMCTAANQTRVRYPFVANSINTTANVWARFSFIGIGASGQTSIGAQSNSVSGATSSYKNFICVDLTLAFGSTIADYAYTLESGNAGDGVAWLKAQGFFKEDYYAYDAGSLQSVETEKAINTGIDPTDIHTYQLGHAKLRGIPGLDADNNIVYSGDTYKSNGKITRRFAEITLNGSESWTRRGTNYYFSYKVGDYGTVVNYHSVSTQYEAVAISTGNTVIGVTLINSSTYNGAFINIRPEGFASMTAAQFQALLVANPITVAYELSTPTTESSASFTSLQFAEAGGTEQLVDYAFNHGTRDIEIPVGADIDYGVIRFAGYLIAVRNSQNVFTPIPLDYMRYESYNVAPDQRLDLDTTRDTTGVLHRTVLAHTATKVTFNVPCMPAWKVQELFDYFRTAFKQTNGDTQAHKLELKYYDEWEDEYKTGIMYMPDITFQIRNIDGRTINYSETKVTFIEY